VERSKEKPVFSRKFVQSLKVS